MRDVLPVRTAGPNMWISAEAFLHMSFLRMVILRSASYSE